MRYEGYTREHPVGRDAENKVSGKGCLLSIALPRVPPCQHLHVFGGLEAFRTLYFRDFYGSFITQARLIKSLALSD